MSVCLAIKQTNKIKTENRNFLSVCACVSLVDEFIEKLTHKTKTTTTTKKLR